MGGGGTYPLGIGSPEIRVRGGGQNFGLPPRFLFWPHPCKKKLWPLCLNQKQYSTEEKELMKIC